MKIDPWASVDIKDYDKIMDQFGISKIGDVYKKLHITGYEHFLFF